LNTLTICRTVADNEEREIFTFDGDIRAEILKHFEEWPTGARLYHQYVAMSCDITPVTKDDVDAIEQLTGEFFIVIYPEFTIGIIIAIIISAISIGLSFLLRPSKPHPSSISPNNSLADRSNQQRPNERIPDIVGTVRAVPDLIGLPYKQYASNQQLETANMCLGRGSYTIYDAKDDTTPIQEETGASAFFYAPFTSPNKPGSVPQLTIGTGTPDIIRAARACTAVNGQYITAPNANRVHGNNDIVFSGLGVITCSDGLFDFTDFFQASTPQTTHQLQISNGNCYDANHSGITANVDGLYTILDVTSNTLTLSNAQDVNAGWNAVNAFPSGQSNATQALLEGSGTNWTDSFVLNVGDATEVWCNFSAPNGLYYTDSSNNQHRVNVDLEVGVTAVDSSGSPVGSERLFSATMQGSANTTAARGITIKCVLPYAGPISVRAHRINNRDNATGNITTVDSVQWTEFYAMSPFAGTDFGNVTIVQAITVATNAATSVKERKFNCLVTRNIPAYQGGGVFSTALVPQNNAAAIFCFVALDPRIGNRTKEEVDVDGIYAAINAASANFGTGLSVEFCYTFDSANMSFEEIATDIAAACNCIAFRRGNVIGLSFEGQTANSSLLFNHRNKLPNSETRTVTFGAIGNNDGIEYDFVDPNAPSYPNVDTPRTLYFPPDQSATNPKKVKSIGVRNKAQATFNGWRLYQKLLYQNTNVQFSCTSEGALLVVSNRILVADNTRPDTQDGEIVSQSGLTIGLSRRATFGDASYTIFLQHYDLTVEAIPLTGLIDAKHVVLSRPPAVPLVFESDKYAATTYQIVASTDQRATPFLVTEKKKAGSNTFTVTAVNYDARYYAHDTDLTSGVITPDGGGYGPAGYLGNSAGFGYVGFTPVYAAPPVPVQGGSGPGEPPAPISHGGGPPGYDPA
jgi:hypothetical protein